MRIFPGYLSVITRRENENMNNKNQSRAKILTLIPVIIFVITAVIMLLLMISYFSTGSDVTAVAMIFTGSFSLIITTLPCLVMSVAGTVYAARAKKEGIPASRKYYVIGVIEIIVYSLGVICTIFAVFITIIAAGR